MFGKALKLYPKSMAKPRGIALKRWILVTPMTLIIDSIIVLIRLLISSDFNGGNKDILVIREQPKKLCPSFQHFFLSSKWRIGY